MTLNVTRECSLSEQVDELYEKIRIQVVKDMPSNERRDVLKQIYGPRWNRAGVLPRTGKSDVIQKVLQFYPLSDDMNPLLREEYRRLQNALAYQRKTFCLDMDGLLIEKHVPIDGMKEIIGQLKIRHAVVVTTAAPTAEAREMLGKAGYDDLLVFGDLKDARGKKYLPVASYFGYSRPEDRLVAVGHSTSDSPADISIPFIYLDVPQHQLASALKAGVASLEKKPYKGFEIENSSNEVKVSKAA
ncbi:Uncharacterised protein [uncultured archaeon]|nr:Uncharacterised protein [uncultured archaeon]